MKIIVVDDEPVIADTLVNMLLGEGHDAFAVSNGKSAISLTKLMRPVQPDLLVSDVIRTNELQVWFIAEHVVDTPVVRAE